MSGDTENGTTTICVTKRPRPTGCVAVFYQLIHWNTRLANNNKHFSNNLLSSGTHNHSSSKRFATHDNLSFHRIAEENRGGFPNLNKTGGHSMDIVQHEHEMRPPTLVARLMGLDSIPTPHKQQPKHPHFQLSPKMDEKLVCAHRCSHKVLEEGLLKNVPLPQKMHKTGHFDILAVARFRPDSSNVFSHSSRKHHKGAHLTKLPTPMKSPRVRSGWNGARFIDAAATKILDPGLRVAKSRAKSVTHSHQVRLDLNQQGVRQDTAVKPLDLSSHTICHPNLTESFEGLSPCKSFGLPNTNYWFPQVKAEQHFPYIFNVSTNAKLSPQKLQSSKFRTCMSSMEQDNDRPYGLDSDPPVYVVSQSPNNMPNRNAHLKGKRPFNTDNRKDWDFSNCAHETPTRSKISSFQSQRVTSSVNGMSKIKEISSLSQRVGGKRRTRMQEKVDNILINEMKQSSFRSQTMTPGQKRRILTRNGKVDNNSSSLVKLGITKFDRLKSCSSQSQSKLEIKFDSQGTNDICAKLLSSTFPSHNRLLTEDKIGDPADKMATIKETTAKSLVQHIPLSADVFSAPLEQKHKEITSGEEREQATGGAQSKRTTSKILQEMISALAVEHHESKAARAAEINQKDELYHRTSDSCSDVIVHHHGIITREKAKKMMEDPSIRCLCDSDHLSPESAIGASFSIRSCISSSQDDHSESILQHGSMESAHLFSPPSELATHLRHVTSTGAGSTIDLLESISIILDELGQRGSAFTTNNLSHVKEVIANVGLLLEVGVQVKSTGGKEEFFICHFFDQLEAFANASLCNSKDPLCYSVARNKTRAVGILFDLAIEYLNYRFGKNSELGVDLRRRPPLRLTARELIFGLIHEISEWADLAGKTSNELIEWEVSHSSGIMTDYEIEVCSICCEVSAEVVKSLVEEIVMDNY